MHFIGLGIYQV